MGFFLNRNDGSTEYISNSYLRMLLISNSNNERVKLENASNDELLFLKRVGVVIPTVSSNDFEEELTNIFTKSNIEDLSVLTTLSQIHMFALAYLYHEGTINSNDIIKFLKIRSVDTRSTLLVSWLNKQEEGFNIFESLEISIKKLAKETEIPVNEQITDDIVSEVISNMETIFNEIKERNIKITKSDFDKYSSTLFAFANSWLTNEEYQKKDTAINITFLAVIVAAELLLLIPFAGPALFAAARIAAIVGYAASLSILENNFKTGYINVALPESIKRLSNYITLGLADDKFSKRLDASQFSSTKDFTILFKEIFAGCMSEAFAANAPKYAKQLFKFGEYSYPKVYYGRLLENYVNTITGSGDPLITDLQNSSEITKWINDNKENQAFSTVTNSDAINKDNIATAILRK